MFRSTTARIVLGVLAIIIVLGVLRFKPWQRFTASDTGVNNPNNPRGQLAVGFLPVT